MTMVWNRLESGGGELLLALALADIADDKGERIYPSVSTLATKTRQDRRTVQRQLSKFRDSGWLIPKGSIKGGRTSTHYCINPDWLTHDKLPQVGEKRGGNTSAEGRQLIRTGAALDRPSHDTAMSHDPSSYPSLSVINHPRKTIKKELEPEEIESRKRSMADLLATLRAPQEV